MDVKYVTTKDQLADLFTKPLVADQHFRLLSVLLGVSPNFAKFLDVRELSAMHEVDNAMKKLAVRQAAASAYRAVTDKRCWGGDAQGTYAKGFAPACPSKAGAFPK